MGERKESVDLDARDRIWSLVRNRATYLLENDDTASVFQKNRVLNKLRKKVYNTPEEKADSLVALHTEADMPRRKFLRMMGLGVGSAVLAGSGVGYFMNQKIFDERNILTAYAAQHDINFRNTTTVSPGSGENAASAINSTLSSGTLVEVESGEYTCSGQINMQNKSGIKGDPDNPSQVVLTMPKGQTTTWVATSGTNNTLINGFTVDQRDDYDTASAAALNSQGGLNVLNLHLKGNHPPDSKTGKTPLVITNIKNKDGEGVFHNIQMDGHGRGYEYPNTRTMLWMGPNHTGLTKFSQLFFDKGSNHTIYGARLKGAVQVTNSLFRNNDNSNLRISGTDNGVAPTFVKDSAIHIDDSMLTEKNTANRYRGLQLEANSRNLPQNISPSERPVIENCDFYCADSGSVGLDGLVKFRWNSHPGAIFKNCRFRDESNGTIFSFDRGGGSADKTVEFIDCHVSGNTSVSGAGARPVIVKGGCWEIARPSGIQFQNVASSGCDNPDTGENPVTWGSAVSAASTGTKGSDSMC